LGKKQTHKTRPNRYKKSARLRYERLLRHLLTATKLCALLVLLFLVSSGFVVGYAAVTSSDYFRAQSIQVTGLHLLSRDQVLAQAGLSGGENVLAVNLHLVRKRLLANPWVSQVRVSRQIPGAITVEIQEHEPLAVIDLGPGLLVDAHGRLFKAYEAGDPQDLPLITGIAYTEISLADDALSPALETVLQVLRACRSPESPVPYARVWQIHFDPEIGVSLTRRGDQKQFKLGLGSYETKFLRLKRLLPHLQRNRQWQAYQVVDLNNPDRVVVQLQQEQGT
jgi:cell division protein FtsQ